MSQRWLSAEEISLAAIAFGSLGHHLPGFMRAYGDRDLFARYRLRFLLVPLLVFGMALLFSPPSVVRSALNLSWTHLHGLEIVLLVWGTWHGLMQTYGFMRIYDVRMGVNDRWTAWLDHLLCLSVFVAGVAFSDSRMFGVADAMWQTGLPLFGPEWIGWTRMVVGGAGPLRAGRLCDQSSSPPPARHPAQLDQAAADRHDWLVLLCTLAACRPT